MTASSLTGIIDYGVGNIRSVRSAVEKVGGTPVVSSDPAELLACARLILPGVGAFAHGMGELKARGLDAVVQQAAADGFPVLGICLGMQMMMSRSLEFGDTQGLGLASGTVTLIETPKGATQLRLPHVAWKPLERIDARAEWFFDGVDRDARFYFIHSFAAQGHVPDAAAWSAHDGVRFAAVVARSNVVATQFHPEKSGLAGLRLLGNFVSKGR